MSDDSIDPEEKVIDPFSPEHSGSFTLVALLRLYDVGMALLREQDAEAAARLHELHKDGRLLGSFPWINPDQGNT